MVFLLVVVISPSHKNPVTILFRKVQKYTTSNFIKEIQAGILHRVSALLFRDMALQPDIRLYTFLLQIHILISFIVPILKMKINLAQAIVQLIGQILFLFALALMVAKSFMPRMTSISNIRLFPLALVLNPTPSTTSTTIPGTVTSM